MLTSVKASPSPASARGKSAAWTANLSDHSNLSSLKTGISTPVFNAACDKVSKSSPQVARACSNPFLSISASCVSLLTLPLKFSSSWLALVPILELSISFVNSLISLSNCSFSNCAFSASCFLFCIIKKCSCFS